MKSCLFERGDLVRQDVKHRGILVAHVKVDPLRFHGPCRDQGAFEHLMRVALEVVTILEGPGFTFIAIDGHQAGTRERADDLPLLAGRKTGAAETAQSGVGHLLDDVFDLAFALAALCQHRVTALGAVGGEIRVLGDIRIVLAALHRSLDSLGLGVVHEVMTDLAHRRGIATAHARRFDNADLSGIDIGFQCVVKRMRALDRAGDRVADADGRRRRRRLTFLHHVEMGVEGGHLVGGRLRQAQFIAERSQMPRRDAVIVVLNQMEIFDQQVVSPGTVAQQLSDLFKRCEIELPSFGKLSRALTGSDVSCGPIRPAAQRGFLLHCSTSLFRAGI